METAIIREQLHNYLERAEDKKIKAIYTMVEDEVNRIDSEYSDDFKAELDKRYNDYKNGKAKIITAAESKKE